MRACSLPSVDDRREPALAAQQRTTACVNVTMLVLRLATKAPAVRAFDYSVDFAVCVDCVDLGTNRKVCYRFCLFASRASSHWIRIMDGLFPREIRVENDCQKLKSLDFRL